MTTNHSHLSRQPALVVDYVDIGPPEKCDLLSRLLACCQLHARGGPKPISARGLALFNQTTARGFLMPLDEIQRLHASGKPYSCREEHS